MLMPVQQNSFTHLRVLLALTDTGIIIIMNMLMPAQHNSFTHLCVLQVITHNSIIIIITNILIQIKEISTII